MSDLFISYSRKDRAFIEHLFAALQGASRDVWVDWEDIPPSAEWRVEIQAAIEAADAFLFVISPDSLSSKVCAEELAHAVSQNKRLIPLVHRDPAGETVPEALARLNYIYGRTQDSFDQVLQTLLQTLDTDLAQARAHTRLLVRGREWESHGRVDGYLLRGEDLREAETWLAMSGAKEPHATAVHAEYISASRQAETRRQRRLLIWAGAALVVMTVLAALAIWQAGVATRREQARATQQAIAVANEQLANQREMARATQQAIAVANEQLANQREMARATQEAIAKHQAELNESGRLAALARLEINNRNPETAVQLALYALENLPYSVQAEEALAQAVQSSRLRGYLPEVQSARWSPDGNSWAVVRPDNAVALVDASTQKEHWRVPFDSQVLLLSWSPTGDRLLVEEKDGNDSLLAAADGRLLLARNSPPLGEYASIRSKWAPDGSRIATNLEYPNSSTGEAVQIWDPDSGETMLSLSVDPKTLDNETDALSVFGDLAWSPDGSQIVVVQPLYGCCGMISLWDARSGRMLNVFGRAPYHFVDWSPDGRWVATSGMEHGGIPVVWDTESWTPLDRLPSDQSVRTWEIAWSPDSRYLAAVSADEDTLWVWNIEQNKLELQITGNFDQVDWAPDGDRLLAHERAPARASLLSLRPANYQLELNGGQAGAWSADGSRVLNASPPRVYLVSNALANQAVQPTATDLPFLDETIWYGATYHLTWFANERLAVTNNFTNELWDLKLGTPLPLDESLAESLADSVVSWSPSGSQYAIARWEGHQVYDAGGKLRYTLPPGAQRETESNDLSSIQIAWNPTETQLATSDGNLVRLWDAANGEALGVLDNGQFPVTSLSWSPDGSRLATATGFALIGAVGYSAEGENLVRVWDTNSYQEVYRLESPDDDIINLVAWSPDGNYLLTGNPIPGQDELRIWRIWPNLEDLITFAHQCCTVHQLSEAELGRFGLGK